MMNIKNFDAATQAAIMNWDNPKAQATSTYIGKEFNALLGVDEDNGNPIYMYDGDAAISRGIIIPQEKAIERLETKTQIEAKLREKVLEECLPDVKEELLGLEETVRELYAQWNSEGNVGITPDFPEVKRLNELRDQIIEESEELKALREKGWMESCMHLDTFNKFIDRIGVPLDNGKVREYLRFLTPIKLKAAIDEKNKAWKLAHNWEDNYSHEELMEFKRLLWSDNRRNKDLNFKREGSKFDVFYSQLIEGLKSITFSLYKSHNLIDYYSDQVDSLRDFEAFNRELIEDGVSTFEIIPRFYHLYDEEIIGEDQLRKLIGDPEDFDKAFTWIKNASEYKKECIHTGEIRAFKSMFYDLSLWKVEDICYRGETYRTRMGLVYGLMINPEKTEVKAAFKQAKDFNGIKLAQAKAVNNHAYMKETSKIESLYEVASLLMENEEFRSTLLKSATFAINITNDPAWSKVLMDTRDDLIAENRAVREEVLAELRDASRIEEEEHAQLIAKYNLSKDQIEEINGALAEREFLGLIKKAEELVEEFYEEV